MGIEAKLLKEMSKKTLLYLREKEMDWKKISIMTIEHFKINGKYT